MLLCPDASTLDLEAVQPGRANAMQKSMITLWEPVLVGTWRPAEPVTDCDRSRGRSTPEPCLAVRSWLLSTRSFLDSDWHRDAADSREAWPPPPLRTQAMVSPIVANSYNEWPWWRRLAFRRPFALSASWLSPVASQDAQHPRVDGESQLALRAKDAHDTAQHEPIPIVTRHHFE
jgi:hypothetical protein